MRRERSPEAEAKKALELSRKIVATKWAAYRAIMSGGKFCIGDKEVYRSVRKRLKSAFREVPERLERFILLDE